MVTIFYIVHFKIAEKYPITRKTVVNPEGNLQYVQIYVVYEL